MKMELHIIQNFAPSCLNRDDTNAPKDCEFGGFRRARISSQCIKRTVRTSPVFKEMLEGHLGLRTKLLVKLLSDSLRAAQMVPDEIDTIVPRFVDQYCGLDEENKTKVLLYLGWDEVERIAAALRENWQQLVTMAAEESPKSEEGRRGRKKEENPFAVLAHEVAKNAVGATKAVDIALFGRMVAESPAENIDAACQVAHAISTHRVNMEMDFYTAVDDISNETGAGMMGTVEFNSACFYRYSLLDLEQLVRNLYGDRELALRAVEAFLRASIEAIPTGKQTSMAAQNLPSFVLVVLRQSGVPQSLANAFERPVLAGLGEDKGLVVQSIERLDQYWGSLTKMYGQEEVKRRPVCTLEDVRLTSLGDQRVPSVKDLIAAVGRALA